MKSCRVEAQYLGRDWALYQGDCVEIVRGLPDDSMGLCLFSPPFSSLYSYSASERDMGNCADDAEFYEHFGFLIPELLRVTIPGRLCVVHVKNLPRYKTHDGVSGLRDFRGEVIWWMEQFGWVFHSEVCIWTDPLREMQRTKVQRLLHCQVIKDASLCGQGVPEYLIIFRRWDGLHGLSASTQPVEHPGGFTDYLGSDTIRETRQPERSHRIWQRYASPVWDDIRRTDVLNSAVARVDDDEKHLAPLQLEVIRRVITLWTNPGDVVFTPFAGIGSEMVGAIELGRRAVGIELKGKYCQINVRNIQAAQERMRQVHLPGVGIV